MLEKKKQIEKHECVWESVSYNAIYYSYLEPYVWPFSNMQNSERQLKWMKEKMMNH